MTQRVKRVQLGSTGFDVRIKLWGLACQTQRPQSTEAGLEQTPRKFLPREVCLTQFAQISPKLPDHVPLLFSSKDVLTVGGYTARNTF